jgi:hypothetical protein
MILDYLSKIKFLRIGIDASSKWIARISSAKIVVIAISVFIFASSSGWIAYILLACIVVATINDVKDKISRNHYLSSHCTDGVYMQAPSTQVSVVHALLSLQTTSAQVFMYVIHSI